MSAFTVAEPTVTATDAPLKLVFWKGVVATEMSAGLKPLPVITKTAPCATGELNGISLAAFATLVITGAAESRATPPIPREKKDTKGHSTLASSSSIRFSSKILPPKEPV
jgi:hypothetical protein